MSAAVTTAERRIHERVGSTLNGKYTLERVLGVGGMAAVYLGVHRNGHRVAVKVLHTEVSLDDVLAARFVREGYVANSIDHRGAVRVIDDDVTEDGVRFLVMDLLEGETLEQTAARAGGRLPLRDALVIGYRLLDALEAAHEKQIIHRDLKPENIFLTRDGELKILDFGIARFRASGAVALETYAGALLGTPAFMPPEQALGHRDDIDARADVWATGALLFTLYTGKFVHDAPSITEMVMRAATRPARSLASVAPDAPAEVVSVIDRALRFDKADRWPTASAMQAAIADAFASLESAPISSAFLPAPVAPPSLRGSSAMLPRVATPRVDSGVPVALAAPTLAASTLAAPSSRRVASLPPVEDAIPDTLGGGYSIVRVLGKGGMGTVYEAVGTDGARVAVKVLSEALARSEAQIARFEREARAVAKLDTPHVARVIETGVDAALGLPFIVMELLEGEDVRATLQRLECLPEAAAVQIALQACEALSEAHRAHLLHRDIKPANLFLATGQGARRTVKLLDFGVAKSVVTRKEGTDPGSLTQSGGLVGSPQYMSPEHVRGARDLDVRADVWSLGVVLYQMLCGSTPHGKAIEVGELIVKICTCPPDPIQDRAPWVSPELAAVVHRALRMSPDDRFPSAQAFCEALSALAPLAVDLDETSLRRLTHAERAFVADKLSPDLLDGRAAAPSLSGFAGGPESHVTSRLTAPSPAAPRTSSGWRTAVAVLAMAGLSSAGYALSRPARPVVEGARDPAPALPHEVTVRVAIVPPDAGVRVDGVPSTVREGFADVRGENGSVHVVRVEASGEFVETEVVIADQRSVPAQVELKVAVRPAIPSSTPPVSRPAGPSPLPKAAPHGTAPVLRTAR
jgi:serine/threonine-protein kinase